MKKPYRFLAMLMACLLVAGSVYGSGILTFATPMESDSIVISEDSSTDDIIIESSEISEKSSSEEDITIIPESESDEILIEDETLESPTENHSDTNDEIVISEEETESEHAQEIILEEEPKDNFASVFLGDNVDVHATLNASDFASMRLLVEISDDTLIPVQEQIVGQYENLYLLEFTSIQQTMNAYVHFKNHGCLVEPDMLVMSADSDDIIITPEDEITSEENPLAKLSELSTDDMNVKENNVIALIDTFVSNHGNVIAKTSVFHTESERNSSHGDKMVEAIVGQNPDANILSIEALNENGTGTVSSLVAAMEYAIDANVDMINLSCYARSSLSTSIMVAEIQKAIDAGITVIGAAGNDGVDVIDYIPGSVESAYIIGAAKEDGSRLDISNFGATVDYNVVADSTSEATAKFTGYLSKNGLDAISEVLNQGLIYEPMVDTNESEEEPFVTGEEVQMQISVLEMRASITVNDTKVIEDKQMFSVVSGADFHCEIVPEQGYYIREILLMSAETGEPFDGIQGYHMAQKESWTFQAPCEDFILQVKFEALTEEQLQERNAEKNDSFDTENELFEVAANIGDKKTVTVYDKRYNNGLLKVGYFELGDIKAFCSEHENAPPQIGEVGTVAEAWADNKTERGRALRKILWYGCGGPGDIGPEPNTSGGVYQDKDEVSIGSHWRRTSLAASYVRGHDDSLGKYGQKFLAYLDKTYANVPDDNGFVVYRLYTKSDNVQDLVFYEYNPEKKISLTAQKTWDDQNNKYQTRPSRLGFQLQRREKPNGGSWSNWSDYRAPSYATGASGWKVTWKDELALDRNKKEYQYRVKELVPTHYRVDGSDTKDFPTGGGTVTFKNILNDGYLKIVKQSDNPEMTNDNKCYDLAGAEFEIYTDASCTKKANYSGGPIVTQKVTNADGSVSYETRVVELVIGTYYVKETKPPKGFEIIDENQPYQVDITVNHRQDQPFTLSVTNRAENDPMVISITKLQEGAETETIPSLAGTQFTVWYYDNLNKDVSGTPKKTWVLEVKQRPNGRWICRLDDEHLVKEESDDFYRLPNSKAPILPYGTYKIQETKHAPGYTFEGGFTNADGTVSISAKDPYITVVDKDTTGGIHLSGGNEYSATNKTVPMSITLKKFGNGKQPLAGVTFKIQSKSGYAETQPNFQKELTTGSDGTVKWADLYPDVYIVTEIKTVDGYSLLQDPIEIQVPYRLTKEEANRQNLVDPNQKDDLDGVIWDEETQTYYVTDLVFDITNDMTFSVPSTGGTFSWTMLLTLGIGIGLWVVLAWWYVRRKLV